MWYFPLRSLTMDQRCQNTCSYKLLFSLRYMERLHSNDIFKAAIQLQVFGLIGGKLILIFKKLESHDAGMEAMTFAGDQDKLRGEI